MQPPPDASPGDRYLWLMKQVLTDMLRIDNPQASLSPLEYLGSRKLRRRITNALARIVNIPFGTVPMLPDSRSIEARRARRTEGTDWPQLGETMVGMQRLDHLQMLVERVLDEGVPGDLLEAGVWRGGASIFMQAVLTLHGATDRQVWVCDSFQGLPPPDPNIPADAGSKFHKFDMLAVSEETVRGNFARYGLLGDNVLFVKGFFEETLAHVPVTQLAILRMDGDMYSSTMATLEPLYDKVAPGGFVVIDDYWLTECEKAVSDFRARRGIEAPIERIDASSAFWRKP